jgi:hypothetical protein
VNSLTAHVLWGNIGGKSIFSERDASRKQQAKGIDPGVHRKAQRAARANGAANSFEVVAREWLKIYIDPISERHRTSGSKTAQATVTLTVQ